MPGSAELSVATRVWPRLGWSRRRGGACEMAAAWLPALAGGDEEVSRRARMHVQTCLRCQADLVRYRRLLRTLRGLRNHPVTPAPGALGAALAAIEAVGVAGGAEAMAGGHRAAYLFAMVGATAAAGAAGAMVWATRRRGALTS
ncbi:MAG: hypothetical protein ACR2NJ_01900, partial [Acidimicrobiales bacterium]